MLNVPRLIEDKVIESLETFPVVFIAGPRQSGKTTLVETILANRYPAEYVTFDDIQMRSAAKHDPMAFLESFQGPVVLDEIQLVPELFRPVKIMVDRKRRDKNGGRGKFLLTGSASILALPALSDALVGRMVLHTLYPLSAKELALQQGVSFIDKLFSDDWQFARLPKENLMDKMMSASFPELLQIESKALRDRWCNGYIETILQRDVRALMEVEKIEVIPQLLQLIAFRTGGLLNESSLSRDTDLNHATAKKYRVLLEGLFLIQSIPAWSSNLGTRLIKAPKLYMADLNLLLYLMNTDIDGVYVTNKTLFGSIFENYVAIELAKQLAFSTVQASLYHYRTAAGKEIDFILEGPNASIVGVEVKARTSVTAHDFQHLESLQATMGKKFKRGIVVYLGNDVVSFGKNLWAVPATLLG